MDKKRYYKNWVCKCKNCEKDIDAYEYNGFSNYAYKLPKEKIRKDAYRIVDKYYIFCSWHCLRDYEKKNSKDVATLNYNGRRVKVYEY